MIFWFSCQILLSCTVFLMLICYVLQFNSILNTIFSSPAMVGFIVAVFLDNTIDVGRSKKDRGMPWWGRFRKFGGDSRSEEFYALPFNLNKCFPPTWFRWKWEVVLDADFHESITNKTNVILSLSLIFLFFSGSCESCSHGWL